MAETILCYCCWGLTVAAPQGQGRLPLRWWVAVLLLRLLEGCGGGGGGGFVCPDRLVDFCTIFLRRVVDRPALGSADDADAALHMNTTPLQLC